MKITFIGTGTMGCITRSNTSILVDDILFDIGMGTIKQLERLQKHTKDINYIVITHFHADHFFDLPNVLIGKLIRNEIDNKLLLIGPKGLKQKTIDLFYLGGHEGTIDKFIEEHIVEFIELDENETYSTENFKITAIPLKHGDSVDNGYILEKEERKLSYITDSTICENVEKLVKASDNIFIDCTGTQTNANHIGLNDLKEMASNYKYKNFYAIHRGDYECSNFENIYFPLDGETLEI